MSTGDVHRGRYSGITNEGILQGGRSYAVNEEEEAGSVCSDDSLHSKLEIDYAVKARRHADGRACLAIAFDAQEG